MQRKLCEAICCFFILNDKDLLDINDDGNQLQVLFLDINVDIESVVVKALLVIVIALKHQVQ